MAVIAPLSVTTVDVKDTGDGFVRFSVTTGASESGEASCLVDVTGTNDTEFVAKKVDQATFRGLIKEEAAKMGAKCVMLHTHGFNTSPQSLYENSLDFQVRMKETLVIPVLWPANDDKFLTNLYFADKRGIPEDAKNFVPLLDFFFEGDEDSLPTSLMCHSMGNYVLRWVAQLAAADGPSEAPRRFQHIFMVAADVDSDIFSESQNDDKENPENNPGLAIAEIVAGNVFALHSRNDLTLIGRLFLNGFAGALGRNGAELDKIHPSIKGKVVNINCDSYNDSMFRNNLGHSYQLVQGSCDIYMMKMLAST